MQPRILIYDIETTPQLQYRWRYWDDGPPIKVVEDNALLCFAYKWLGEDKIHFVKKDPVGTLWQLFDEADVIVAHNNDRFDERMANASFNKAGYGPPSPYQKIDTLKQFRKYMASTSNSLAQLARQYGLSLKEVNSGAELWFRCMANEKAAWKEMESYNKQDVLVLEELYLMIRPWMATGHPNMGFWSKDTVCAKCGSNNWQKRGVRHTAVYERQVALCKDCGGYSTFRRSTRNAGELK